VIAKKGFVLDSVILTGFTGLGVIVGFAVDILVAARFGLGQLTDAYFLATTIPVALLAIVASSSQSILVTAFARSKTSLDDDLFSTILTLSGFCGILLSLLCLFGAPLLMSLLAPGFNETTREIAVRMSRILYWNIPAIMMTEVLRAMLYAKSQLRMSSAGNFLPGAVTVLILLLTPNPSTQLIAWAVLSGSWVGLGWQVITFAWSGVSRYRPIIALHDPSVRQVGFELLAPITGLIFRQGVVIAERWFGSFLPAGSISAIAYASKITQVLAGTLFSSVATAALPSLALAAAERKLQEFRLQWRRLLSLSTLLALPLGLGLAIFSRLFVALLFESGSRDLGPGGAVLLASVLSAYALSLIPMGPFRAQQSFLYATHKPAQVALLFLAVTVVTLLLDWPMIHWFGAPGLGLSFTMGVIVALFIGFRLVHVENKLSPPVESHGNL
jgi:putative peptidoglycan lipid II flippase